MVVNLSGRGDKDVPQVARHPEGQEAVTTRIDARFAELKQAGPLRLRHLRDVPAIRIIATSLEIIKALPKAGADVIELGMPFTDPMADGPVDPGRWPARAEGRHDAEEDAGSGARASARTTTPRRWC